MSAQSAQYEHGRTATPRQAITLVAGMLAAWLAAGSIGLVAPPLLMVLSWLALVATAVAARPRPDLTTGLLAVALIIPAALSSETTLCQPFVVTAFLALLASRTERPTCQLLSIASVASFSLALLKLAQFTVPNVWLLTNRVGQLMGSLGATIAGAPLSTGSSFAGIDFLVPMAVVVAAWLLFVSRPTWSAACFAIAAIVGGQLLYLVGLAVLPALAHVLPHVPEPEFANPYVPPPFSWTLLVQQWLPWNYPIVAAGIHLSILVLLVRWTRWPDREHASNLGRLPVALASSPRIAWACITILSLATASIALLHRNDGDLSGKRLLANQAGRLDWNKPQHDQYGQSSAGVFGMLPSLVQSLGGQFQTSSVFSASDLNSADVVLLLHPNGTLSADQQRRIWNYVQQGGSLLIVTDSFQPEYGLAGLPPDLLEPISIHVRENSAVSEAGYWEHNLSFAGQGPAAICNLRGSRLMTGGGPSLEIRWPARPLLAGRWAWSSPQFGTAWNGAQWVAGQQLGDLPLMAEQRFGEGKVIVVSDSSNFTNEGIAEGYSFVGATLSYLANRKSGSGAWWRQAGVVLGSLLLLSLLLLRPQPWQLFGSSLLVLAALLVCQRVSEDTSRIIPDGTLIQSPTLPIGNRVAYIDASHVEPFNQMDWVFHAIDGLQLTLMRNGYMPLFAPEITRERLERCGMLITIAPARRFSSREREVVADFVRSGGILICTVGAEESSASAVLLNQFGLQVPNSPVPTTGSWEEPEPMGHIRSLYLNARLRRRRLSLRRHLRRGMARGIESNRRRHSCAGP